MAQISTHVRVSSKTKHALDEFVSASGLQSADEAINNLIAFKREAEFWEQCERGERAIRNDPTAWAEERAERALWDHTLLDGLDDA